MVKLKLESMKIFKKLFSIVYYLTREHDLRQESIVYIFSAYIYVKKHFINQYLKLKLESKHL